MRTVYLNGSFILENEAKISIFDRGFLMSDGVYEVTSVIERKLIDFEGHFHRLERSLFELDMKNPLTKEVLLSIHKSLINKNGVNNGLIYLQITRGSAGDRDFVFPKIKRIFWIALQLFQVSRLYQLRIRGGDVATSKRHNFFIHQLAK